MPATPPTQTTLCPRCESAFECGVAGGSCWCADAPLDRDVRANLATFYKGCLCSDCLKLIADNKPPRPNVWEFLASQFKRRPAD